MSQLSLLSEPFLLMFMWINSWVYSVIWTRARPIRIFWADTDIFQFPLLISMSIFLYYSSSIYFASWGKITTPGAILPSAEAIEHLR